ncbi:hypothetical protein HDU86_006267 [Geranomyces michiganensis]|nr:hypothetical protein HDU86_006267 [Geranomyces michiganensis]
MPAAATGLYQPFRAIGYVTSDSPLNIQIRGNVHALTTSVGHSFHIYGGEKLDLLFTGPHNDEPVTAVAAFRDRIFSASGNGVSIAERGKKIGRWEVEDNAACTISSLLVFGDLLLALCSDNVVRMWNHSSGEFYNEITFPDSFRVTAVVHPSTYVNKILLASQQGTMQLWNIRTLRLLHEFASLDSPITFMTQAPAVDVIAIGLLDGSIVLHNVRADAEIMRLRQEGKVTAISFRTDEKPHMVTASISGDFAVWDLSKQQVLNVIKGAHNAPIHTAYYYAGQPILITAGGDNAIRQWIFDSAEGVPRLLRSRGGHMTPPTRIRYHPQDHSQIISGGVDDAIRVFSVTRDANSMEIPLGEKKNKGFRIDDAKIAAVAQFACENILAQLASENEMRLRQLSELNLPENEAALFPVPVWFAKLRSESKQASLIYPSFGGDDPSPPKDRCSSTERPHRPWQTPVLTSLWCALGALAGLAVSAAIPLVAPRQTGRFSDWAFAAVAALALYQTVTLHNTKKKLRKVRSEYKEMEGKSHLNRIAFEINPSAMSIVQFVKDDQGVFDYRLIFLNEAGAANYGMAMSDIVGKWVVKNLHRPQDPVNSVCMHLNQAKETGGVIQWEQEYPSFLAHNDDSARESGESGDTGKRTLTLRAVHLGIVSPEQGDLALLITRDITEEQHNLLRLELLMEAAADGFWEWHVKRNTCTFGPNLARRLGYNSEEFSQNHIEVAEITKTLHPDEKGMVELFLEDFAKNPPRDGVYTLERRYQTKNGDWVWLLDKGRVISKDANDRPLKVVGAHIDIHSRKMIEEALRQKQTQLDENQRLIEVANKELSQALRFKSEFIANISHELRTPLHGLLGLGRILWDTQLDDEQRDLLKHIRECSDGLLLLVNDVLDFSKATAGKMVLELIPFDLKACVESAASVIRTKANEKGITMSVDLDPKIPKVLIGDGNRLRQVLLNIAGNAVKFCLAGRVDIIVSVVDETYRNGRPATDRTPLTMHTSSHDLTDVALMSVVKTSRGATNDVPISPVKTEPAVAATAVAPVAGTVAVEPPVLVCFEIRDTGIGISEDQFPRLFKPFSQVDSSTARNFGGTGLGLTISKQLVHMMTFPSSDGIHVESKQGVGSTFYFTIPFRQPAPSVANAEAIAPDSEAVLKAQRAAFAEQFPLSILLAEDNKINQKVALRMLEQFGFTQPSHVSVASNGAEAVEMTAARVQSHGTGFHLILMDLQMPKLSGFQATKLIRAAHGSFEDGGPAIVAMTANVMAEDKQMCAEAGMNGHIGKPMFVPALQEVLEQYAHHAFGVAGVPKKVNGST